MVYTAFTVETLLVFVYKHQQSLSWYSTTDHVTSSWYNTTDHVTSSWFNTTDHVTSSWYITSRADLELRKSGGPQGKKVGAWSVMRKICLINYSWPIKSCRQTHAWLYNSCCAPSLVPSWTIGRRGHFSWKVRQLGHGQNYWMDEY